MPREKNSNQGGDEDSSGSPAWMTTFSDLMTLLLVFFVLLYSFSEMDVQKFKGFISSFQNKVGVLQGGTTLSQEEMLNQGSMSDRYNPSPENISKVMEEMRDYAQERNIEDKVEVEKNRRGLVIRLTGQILYDLGKAVIKPEGKKVLGRIAKNINDMPNNIKVEGHTDNLPIDNAKYPSNWELSTTRAINVIKFFIEEYNINPERLSAAGYSKYQPLKKNTGPQARAKNRRVEIVILNSEASENNDSEEVNV